jgi:hypothetical protein
MPGLSYLKRITSKSRVKVPALKTLHTFLGGGGGLKIRQQKTQRGESVDYTSPHEVFGAAAQDEAMGSVDGAQHRR